MDDRLDRIITRLEAETGPGPWGTLIKLLVEECREARGVAARHQGRIESMERRVTVLWMERDGEG